MAFSGGAFTKTEMLMNSFESALKYFGVDSRRYQSSSQRAQIVGVLLNTGRYLFVLDGLEVLQHQEGDQYGLLQNNDLRDLLTFFARPDNQSFCLITSRAPLLDLMDYTTYTHRDVERLSEDDGRALLRILGVKGSDAELNKVVTDWDGHALTLSILAAYLAERYEGNIKHLVDIPVPSADEPRYERVHRVLRRYDEHLTENEREFLKLFSVFRLPVQESAFEKVFEPLLGVKPPKQGKPDSALSKLFKRKKMPDSVDGSPLQEIVNRLVNYRIIRHDEYERAYTTHPLIRNHYFALFTKGDPSQEKAAHSQIKDYYLSIAGDTPQYPTLDDLKPLIEVVHHACQAGAYEEALDIFWNRISQTTARVLIHQLCAYETDISIMQEFFQNSNITKEIQISESNYKRFILNEIGLCLMNLGRLRESVSFYERANVIQLAQQDWHNASLTYQNLADVHISLGALEQELESAAQALEFARRAKNKEDERNSLRYQASALHLCGDLKTASDAFEQAERLEQEIDPGASYLYSVRGIKHADHLRRTSQSDYARRITETNLRICEQAHFAYSPGMCHRVLGDLEADLGNHGSARNYYDTALKRARSEFHFPRVSKEVGSRSP